MTGAPDVSTVSADDHDLFGYPHGTVIRFRGEERVVFYEHECDHVIIWWLPGEETTHGPVGATEAEATAIYQQLWRELEDRWAWEPDE